MIKKIIVSTLIANIFFPLSLMSVDQHIINGDSPKEEVIIVQEQPTIQQQLVLLQNKMQDLQNKQTTSGKFSIFSIVSGACMITGSIVAGTIVHSIINKLKIETVWNETYGYNEPKITFNK